MIAETHQTINNVQYANKHASKRHKPWHVDYDKLTKIHLEKYLDKDFFADFLREAKLQREEEAEAKQVRELKRVSAILTLRNLKI